MRAPVGLARAPWRRFATAIGAVLALILAGCSASAGGGAKASVPATWLTPQVVLHTAAPRPGSGTAVLPRVTPAPALPMASLSPLAPTAALMTLRPPDPPATRVPPSATPLPTAILPPLVALPPLPPELAAAFDTAAQRGRLRTMTAAAPLASGADLAAIGNGTSTATGATPDASLQLVNRISLFNWLYVPVAAFPTIDDDLPLATLRAFWGGDTTAIRDLLNTAAPVLVVDRDTRDWLMTLWGPAPNPSLINVVAPGTVTAEIWKNRKNTFGVVAFSQLVPQLKMLTMDGRNPFSTNFDPGTWPLVRGYDLVGAPDIITSIREILEEQPNFSYTNRDRDDLTVLAMTGVTALTRATAYQMEQTGILLPARDVSPFLLDSDLVHTSNEVSFNPDCPYPNPIGDTTFCSADKYFDLLKAINLKIVELTGNHLNDYGRDAFLHTLDMYDSAGMLRFGGGRNADDARQPALIDDHGNRLAFIGCNPVGPAYDWAKADQAGSNPCDDDYLKTEISSLKAQGFLVIMTIQYEEYYFYETPPAQRDFFKKYADFGADLVMGSQAHTPQGFDFVNRAFIHYGIGNLFFDQMDYINTRQMFADRLVFYRGRLLGAQLFTGLNEDYSRVRPMTPTERADFLRTMFEASGW